MRFKGLDLNLIWALQVLMEERNVTAAARRMHLSQPAMSGALSRLREYFDDDLIVAVGRNMVPTARGEQLYRESRGLLEEIDRIVSETVTLDVATLDKSFRIAASDYASQVVLAPLVRYLAEVAPCVRIEIIAPSQEAERAFQNGDVDMLIYPAPYTLDAHPSEPLFTDTMTVVGWRENPAMHQPMTQESFLAHQHVIVGSDSHRGFPEQQLKSLKRNMNRAVVATTFHLVGSLLVGTQRLALLHGRLAHLQARSLPLAVADNPFGFEPFEECLQVHAARLSDPTLQWLREAIFSVVREQIV
ncbi:LysR family transcriptional regulator [Chromohalobacter israelensis]|uniref:LysR family transcriptional regulator n=1 Tax=Chromohalobacter israelensis TaxID=141390 RepID=UPI003AF9CA18